MADLPCQETDSLSSNTMHLTLYILIIAPPAFSLYDHPNVFGNLFVELDADFRCIVRKTESFFYNIETLPWKALETCIQEGGD